MKNANQLIRYYIPKGTNINDIPKVKMSFIQEDINNKKRKILNYKSSIFFFKNELNKILDIKTQKIYL